MAVYARRKVTA